MNPSLDRSRGREPGVWAARNVEWPLPTGLTPGQFNRLRPAAAAAPLSDYFHSNPQDTPTSAAKNSSNSNQQQQQPQQHDVFSGLMSRLTVSTASPHPTERSSHTASASPSAHQQNQQYPLNPPRPGCVAAANGWIVAALECSVVVDSNNKNAATPTAKPALLTPNTNQTNNTNSNSTAVVVTVVSRWNVRRGGVADPWVALPLVKTTSSLSTTVAHVFVDPTARHILLSTHSGHLFYWPTGSASSSNASATTSTSATTDGAVSSGHSSTPSNTPIVVLPGFGDETTNSSNNHSYITAVAWDKERATEGNTTTQVLLLGTSAGEIYEYALPSSFSGTNTTNLLKTLPPPRRLHQVGGTAVVAAVTGLHVERLRTGLLLLVVTSGKTQPTRFYSFYSPHSSSFAMVLGQQQSLVELPGAMMDFADLHVCGDQFGVRTPTGIYHGTIDRSAVLASASAAIGQASMLPYPQDKDDRRLHDTHDDTTLGVAAVALTPHHFLCLEPHNNTVHFCNLVSQKVIQTEHIDLRQQQQKHHDNSNTADLSGEFLVDVRRPDQVWLRQGRSLVHISASQEDRDVWKYTLQKALTVQNPEQLFEQAKSLCTNQAQKAVVTAIRAEHHLQHHRPELAAKYLAQCPPSIKPFPDTAVRLALLANDSQKNYKPLIAYLQDKMRVHRKNRMTSTMLGAWLTELLLAEADANNDNSKDDNVTPFLQANLDKMDAPTILKLLASHDVGASATFCVQSGDLSTAVNAALSMGGSNDPNSGAMSALLILNDASFELSEPLYYKHAFLLLTRVPSAAGDSFLSKYEQGLSPLRLLPSLMNYERMRTERARVRKAVESAQSKSSASSYGGVEESKTELDVKVGPVTSADGFEMKLDNELGKASSFVDDSSVLVRYLEGVINQGCRESAIYSYLISLFVKLEDEEPLLAFLSKHIPPASTMAAVSKRAMLAGAHLTADDSDTGPLDMSYALRTVLGTGRHFRSAIKLYMGFGMRQQAVELALKVDPSLARDLAQDSVELEERKRLWLMIAKQAASDGSGRGRDVVSRVVAVLKDCGPDVLSIEDVLPFLPDFTRIDEIKDEICDALTSYSTKIDAFLKEMNDCDKACDVLRNDIGRLRSNQMHLKRDARCALSNKHVLGAGEPFYVFPSGYVFLASALKELVMPYLNDKQRSRVLELEKELERFRGSEKDKLVLQRELDGLVAAECPLTGSIMVESIDKDFEDSEEYFNRQDTGRVSPERVDV